MEKVSQNDLFINAFHLSAIGMAIVSMEGKWLKVNSSICKILGYTAAELEQITFQDITHPDDLELDLHNLYQILNGEIQYYEMEKRYIQKNGCIAWGLLSVSLVKDEHHHPLYFISQIQDITEQKVLQEKLEKSERQYRNWIQYSPEPMVIHCEGNIVYVNEAGVKMIRAKSYKDIIGRNITDFLHPDDKEMLKQRIQQMVTINQDLEPCHIRVIDLFNKEIDVRISAVPIDFEGKKAIQVYIADMTQQKRIEKELQRSNDIFRAIFEKSGIGIILRNSKGKVVEVNPTYIEMLGYSEEEIISLKNPVYQADMEKERKLFSELVKGNRDFYQMEKRYIRKDEKTLFTNITVTRLKNHDEVYSLSMIHDISGRKRNEKLIKQSEKRYRALVESSPNAIVVHQEGKIVYANPRFQSLVKAYSDHDFIGQPINRFVHPDYHEKVKERIAKLERNIPVGSLEEKYAVIDGSIVDVEVIATPIEYMDKPAFQIIIQDISERKEMERELNRSQEQYRSVVENVREVIFHTDAQGIWTFLNPAWEDITGYTIEESLGIPFQDFVYQEDREPNNRQFHALIEGGKEYYRKGVRYVTKDGGYRWIEVFSQAALNDQGEIIGTLGTLNDITMRKESEAELKASEERFRLLAEYSSDLITMHDVTGKYLYASPACKEILQYESEEIVGQDSYSFIHPDDRKFVNENHQAIFETGYVVSTYRIRRKDGEYVWFESSSKLLNGLHASEQKLIVVSRNINERKLVEQRLQEANEILQHLSNIDGLTGVSNRRAFDERLEMEWNRGRRNSTPLSFLMIDIDNFKAYNDTYGHQGGDGCLKQVASTINETLGRTTDLLCRYGGEEFCVILPETDVNGAKIVGEKIRVAIERFKNSSC